MLGHQLLVDLSKDYDTWATVHGAESTLPDLPAIHRDHLIGDVDVLRFESVIEAFALAQPTVVINCIGLIKQRERARDSLLAIDVNSRFPHQLALLCGAIGSRLVHISTHCVFSGQRGLYTEEDPVDAQDVYGRSKALGEVVAEPHVLTIRTSLIGRELFTRYSLLEWFLSQNGSTKGYQKAVFSGFPTYAIAEIIRDSILPRPELSGLYHVSAEPINKYDLLCLLKDAYRKEIDIIPDTQVSIDRSLNSDRFRAVTGFTPASWPTMIERMANSHIPYQDWKK